MVSQKKETCKKDIFGIIGYPLGHSLSPLIHNKGFSLYGIDARYERFPTPEGRLLQRILCMRSAPYMGLSVTIPHKRSVLHYLDGVSKAAQKIGAVNTLYWDKERLMGENTDVTGFQVPLVKRGLKPASAVVLGAGGVARAVIVALQSMRVKDIILTSPTQKNAAGLAQEFSCHCLPWEERGKAGADMIINATPVGMHGTAFEDKSPWPANVPLSKNQIIYDLVYFPVVTPLLLQAQAMGAFLLNGMEMLLEQAKGQFQLWTGKELDTEKLWPAIEEYLEKRKGRV